MAVHIKIVDCIRFEIEYMVGCIDTSDGHSVVVSNLSMFEVTHDSSAMSGMENPTERLG